MHPLHCISSLNVYIYINVVGCKKFSRVEDVNIEHWLIPTQFRQKKSCTIMRYMTLYFCYVFISIWFVAKVYLILGMSTLNIDLFQLNLDKSCTIVRYISLYFLLLLLDGAHATVISLQLDTVLLTFIASRKLVLFVFFHSRKAI